MKQILFFLTILIATVSISLSQTRHIARGAGPGELYFAGLWYGIYATPFPSDIYDTLLLAVYRISENGKK